MALIDMAFYIGVLKYAFCAFTAACLVGLIYSFVEQLFPNVFLQRASVSYDGPGRNRSLPLIAVGGLGLIVSLVMWANSPETPPSMFEYGIAFVSAVIFDIGAMMYLKSARTESRPGHTLLGS